MSKIHETTFELSIKFIVKISLRVNLRITIRTTWKKHTKQLIDTRKTDPGRMSLEERLIFTSNVSLLLLSWRVGLFIEIFPFFQVIDEALDRFSPEKLFLSFNGGKDCTVLLDLVTLALKARNIPVTAVTYIYVQPEAPFEEVESFVVACEHFYGVTMEIYRGKLRSTLEQAISAGGGRLKAAFMGQRHTDPYCESLQVFQATDDGWPELVRVNPLLSWSCDNVWEYLLARQVPYCGLYDRGYTSLGDRNNTVPNPHLRTIDANGGISYRPAYELKDDRLERAGRT